MGVRGADKVRLPWPERNHCFCDWTESAFRDDGMHWSAMNHPAPTLRSLRKAPVNITRILGQACLWIHGVDRTWVSSHASLPTHWSVSRTFAPYPAINWNGTGCIFARRETERIATIRASRGDWTASVFQCNRMDWVSFCPTKFCGSALPPLFAEGIREPWMLARSISAI